MWTKVLGDVPPFLLSMFENFQLTFLEIYDSWLDLKLHKKQQLFRFVSLTKDMIKLFWTRWTLLELSFNSQRQCASLPLLTVTFELERRNWILENFTQLLLKRLPNKEWDRNLKATKNLHSIHIHNCCHYNDFYICSPPVFFLRSFI